MRFRRKQTGTADLQRVKICSNLPLKLRADSLIMNLQRVAVIGVNPVDRRTFFMGFGGEDGERVEEAAPRKGLCAQENSGRMYGRVLTVSGYRDNIKIKRRKSV